MIFRNQYGFRRKCGTITAVAEVLDFIYEKLDNRQLKVISALALDLKKAFDSVNHEILLH